MSKHHCVYVKTLLYLEFKPFKNEDCCFNPAYFHLPHMSFHPSIVIGGIYFKCALYRPLLFRLQSLKSHFSQVFILVVLHFTKYDERNFCRKYKKCIQNASMCFPSWNFQTGIILLRFCNNKSSVSIPMFIITDGWPKLQAPLSVHHVVAHFNFPWLPF